MPVPVLNPGSTSESANPRLLPASRLLAVAGPYGCVFAFADRTPALRARFRCSPNA